MLSQSFAQPLRHGHIFRLGNVRISDDMSYVKYMNFFPMKRCLTIHKHLNMYNKLESYKTNLE